MSHIFLFDGCNLHRLLSVQIRIDNTNSMQDCNILLLAPELFITCVSDDERFASEVYDYLFSTLEKQRQFEEGKQIRVDKQLVVLLDNEIKVNDSAMVPKGMVKWALESFLRQDKEKFKDYGVIEFGDGFTIGKILHPSKMEMLTCEICGFFTPYAAELTTHRMTHFGI